MLFILLAPLIAELNGRENTIDRQERPSQETARLSLCRPCLCRLAVLSHHYHCYSVTAVTPLSHFHAARLLLAGYLLLRAARCEKDAPTNIFHCPPPSVSRHALPGSCWRTAAAYTAIHAQSYIASAARPLGSFVLLLRPATFSDLAV